MQGMLVRCTPPERVTFLPLETTWCCHFIIRWCFFFFLFHLLRLGTESILRVKKKKKKEEISVYLSADGWKFTISKVRK